MPADILVRELQAKDLTAWTDLFRRYIDFYRAEVADDVIAATWQRIISKSDGMVGFIAETAEGQPLGIANVVFHASTWSPTAYCYLEDLFVDPAARGGGAGRALIEAVYAEADRRKATRTYWATASDNAVARRLYDRIGKLSPFVQYRR